MKLNIRRVVGTTRRKMAVRLSAFAVVVLAMLGLGMQSAFASYVSVHVGNTAVTLRDCYHPSKAAQPSQSCTGIATVPAGTSVYLICQHAGQSIYGDTIWDYVSTPYGQGYMSDYYVYTGYNGYYPGIDYCNY